MVPVPEVVVPAVVVPVIVPVASEGVVMPIQVLKQQLGVASGASGGKDGRGVPVLPVLPVVPVVAGVLVVPMLTVDPVKWCQQWWCQR